MRHIMLLAVFAAIVTSAFTTVLVNGLIFRVDTVRSAEEVGAESPTVTLGGDADGQIQGDIDCDGDVDAVDGLAVLIEVVALEPLEQAEPCTDVGDIIPAGEGQPGPQGPQGPPGPKGEAGSPGLSEFGGVVVVTESNTDATKSANAECPTGKTAISGGYQVFGATDVIVTLDASGLGWSVAAKKLNVSLVPWSLSAQALCVVIAD